MIREELFSLLKPAGSTFISLTFLIKTHNPNLPPPENVSEDVISSLLALLLAFLANLVKFIIAPQLFVSLSLMQGRLRYGRFELLLAYTDVQK